ncbi:MAG: phage holin family protein [Bauldia sp.]
MSSLVRAVTQAAEREAKRLALMLALLGLAGMFVFIAFGFATAGVYVALLNALGPVPALFIMAAIFLVLALIAFLLGTRKPRARRRITIDEEVEEALPPGREGDRLASLGTVAAAFAFGLVRGFTRRRGR